MSALSQQEFDQTTSALQEQAKNGNVASMKRLGDMYYQGPSGKEENITAALPWWKNAADHGDRPIACKVGVAYLNGTGCQADEKLAFYYILLAADYTDDAEANYYAGYCYEMGVGCHANRSKATPYYEKAALKGHAYAQWRLGDILFPSISPSRQNEGLHWICCAHLAGVPEATRSLDRIGSGTDWAPVINKEIDLIKRNGIDRHATRYEYIEGTGVFKSVLKWTIIGFFVAMLFAVIVCGFMLQMEHFPTLIIVLIIAAFGYFGYWRETN